MKSRLCGALAASALALAGAKALAAGAPPADADLPLAGSGSVERAAAAVYPALVNISAVSRQFSEGRVLRYPSAGSGVVVSAEGHVLTNFHVAGHTTRLRCTLTDGRVLDADVVVHDPLTDLSVLKLRLPQGSGPVAAAPLAADATLSVGDPVLALGNPFALSSSVTLGIVSNPRRVFTDFSGSELSDVELEGGETTGWFTQWIQHDALILPGNSGGPLVDLQGRVVGINELGGGGIGFAIPARVAAEVLRRTLATGKLERGFLGFTALPVAKLGREEGALVGSVLPGSAAEKAGLLPGDLLLDLDGAPVTARFFEQVPVLYQRIAEMPVGKSVRLGIERGGQRQELVATTTLMEPSRGDEVEFRTLGLSAEELTGPSALARNLRVRSGVVLTGLRPGQAAATAKPPLQQGDVLLGVGPRAIAALGDLDGAIAAAPPGDLLVKIQRGDEVLLSVVRVPEKRPGRWGGELPKAWLGAQTQVLTPELARALGREGLKGFRVTEVYPWTEAEKSGLAVGDLVLGLDGERFEASRVQDTDDLRRAVEEREIGARAELSILRDGAERKLPIVLEARPADSDETRRYRQEEFEFTVREVTFLDRVEQRWPRDAAGVLVFEVTSGGWAHMAGLRLGDLIASIDGQEVADVASFERRLRAIVEAKPAVVRVFIRRGASTHFVFLEPEWTEREKS
jgi:serine protease Do